MVAGEAVARLRAHRGAVAADTGNHAHRRERVEIEDRQPLFEGRHRRPRLGRRLRLCRAARDVQPPAGRVRVDVVGAAFAADLAVFRTLYGPSVAAWKASPADVQSAIMTTNRSAFRLI